MPREQKTRFVIFGQGRTGSKLLSSLLSSHPDIHCDDELLNGYYWNMISRRVILPLWRYAPIPLFRYRASKSERPAYGFHLFVDHVRDPVNVIRGLVSEGWLVLHIQRWDLFAQSISIAVAQTTHLWHRKRGQEKQSASVFVPPERFLHWLRLFSDGQIQIQRTLLDIPHLDVIYEDDLLHQAGRCKTSDRILSYLGLPKQALSTTLAKTWERPYSEFVENYEELVVLSRRVGLSSVPGNNEPRSGGDPPDLGTK